MSSNAIQVEDDVYDQLSKNFLELRASEWDENPLEASQNTCSSSGTSPSPFSDFDVVFDEDKASENMMRDTNGHSPSSTLRRGYGGQKDGMSTNASRETHNFSAPSYDIRDGKMRSPPSVSSKKQSRPRGSSSGSDLSSSHRSLSLDDISKSGSSASEAASLERARIRRLKALSPISSKRNLETIDQTDMRHEALQTWRPSSIRSLDDAPSKVQTKEGIRHSNLDSSCVERSSQKLDYPATQHSKERISVGSSREGRHRKKSEASSRKKRYQRQSENAERHRENKSNDRGIQIPKSSSSPSLGELSSKERRRRRNSGDTYRTERPGLRRNDASRSLNDLSDIRRTQRSKHRTSRPLDEQSPKERKHRRSSGDKCPSERPGLSRSDASRSLNDLSDNRLTQRSKHRASRPLGGESSRQRRHRRKSGDTCPSDRPSLNGLSDNRLGQSSMNRSSRSLGELSSRERRHRRKSGDTKPSERPGLSRGNATRSLNDLSCAIQTKERRHRSEPVDIFITNRECNARDLPFEIQTRERRNRSHSVDSSALKSARRNHSAKGVAERRRDQCDSAENIATKNRRHRARPTRSITSELPRRRCHSVDDVFSKRTRSGCRSAEGTSMERQRWNCSTEGLGPRSSPKSAHKVEVVLSKEMCRNRFSSPALARRGKTDPYFSPTTSHQINETHRKNGRKSREEAGSMEFDFTDNSQWNCDLFDDFASERMQVAGETEMEFHATDWKPISAAQNVDELQFKTVEILKSNSIDDIITDIKEWKHSQQMKEWKKSETVKQNKIHESAASVFSAYTLPTTSILIKPRRFHDDLNDETKTSKKGQKLHSLAKKLTKKSKHKGSTTMTYDAYGTRCSSREIITPLADRVAELIEESAEPAAAELKVKMERMAKNTPLTLDTMDCLHQSWSGWET